MKKRSYVKHGELEQDFELNIAPVIDCFVVLIAFILVSTSFFSIGILDAVMAGSSSEVTDSAEALVIELKSDHSILVKQGAGSANSVRIKAPQDRSKWDFEKLGQAIVSIRDKTTDLESAVVVADNSVAYRDVMASMEVVRSNKIGTVTLGGF